MVHDFEGFLTDVIQRCLNDLLGRNAAEVFSSHIDPKLASEDPQGFVSKIRSVTGPIVSEVIVRKIENSLSQRLGKSLVARSVDFPEFVQSSRTAFAEQYVRI
jgi:hypothetical protein